MPQRPDRFPTRQRARLHIVHLEGCAERLRNIWMRWSGADEQRAAVEEAWPELAMALRDFCDPRDWTGKDLPRWTPRGTPGAVAAVVPVEVGRAAAAVLRRDGRAMFASLADQLEQEGGVPSRGESTSSP